MFGTPHLRSREASHSRCKVLVKLPVSYEPDAQVGCGIARGRAGVLSCAGTDRGSRSCSCCDKPIIS